MTSSINELLGKSKKNFTIGKSDIKLSDEIVYPNSDVNVWLRSCEQEIIQPIKPDVIKGEIPSWLNGSLLRNGPGNLKVGEMEFNHLFDSSALLHRFAIKNGEVTYQSRFIQTDSYTKNKAANRIVVTEFGTSSVPDPCHNIFHRVTSIFKSSESCSDNTMISIYPFGDEYYSFTENPVIHKINPETLATEKKINLTEYIGIVNHTSHPHILSNKTVYNLGMSVTKNGPAYNIICFPYGERMFQDAYVVGSVPARWKLHPGYMHTFGMTENFFIIVEQPLTISVPLLIKAQLRNQPMSSSFKWFSDKGTTIYVLDRITGELKFTFRTETFFYLHIINQYEKENHIILDICCYKDPSMINCMYIETMKNMNRNPDYANMFRGKPLRFVLPLISEHKSLKKRNLFSKFKKESRLPENLIKLPNTKAQAFKYPNKPIFCKPELLCELGCETPQVNYKQHLGKEYRYFYAISSDVDVENPGTLIKVDVVNKTRKTWCEENCYPSEPIFVPRPSSEFEDDGVILSAMVWGFDEEKRVGLLVLCAKEWNEIGRCEFNTPGPVPKCLHGWFDNKGSF